MSQIKRFILFIVYIAVICIISAAATGYLIYNKAVYGQYTYLVPPFLNMIAAVIGALVLFKNNFKRK